MEAARRIRVSKEDLSQNDIGGDPLELFWTDGVRRETEISFAVEVIVPREVQDEFGRNARASITFLRYELVLGYEPPSGLAHLGRLVLKHEELKHLNLTDANQRLRFPHSSSRFRKHVLKGRRSGAAFISTRTDESGLSTIYVHQDGGSRGQPRPSPATSAPRTIVNTTTTSSDPTILAFRRELQSWRFLALEPTAMRSGDHFTAEPNLSPSGAHLAAALYRLATTPDVETGKADPESVYSRIAMRASELIGVQEIRIDRDDQRRRLTLQLRERLGDFLPSRALSDGTLRFLALCLIEADPSFIGVLCMEEPENGIHPARMEAMADLVRDLSVDSDEVPGPDNPMRQVIINTHSPLFVQLQKSDDLLFIEPVVLRSSDGRPISTIRLRPLKNTWRCAEQEPGIGLSQILAYLQAPPGRQLTLDHLLPEEE